MTAVPIPPSIDATFGALYLGSILATVLYGFTTNQAYVYWHTYGGEDSTGTQMLVFGLWALDSLQVVLVVHMSWFYLVAGFGDPTILTDLVWSFCLELGVTVFVTFTVRALYMLQLWRLSDGNAYLVFPAFLFAAAQLGLGIQTTIHMLSDPTIDIIPSKPFQWILGTKCITSVLSDIIITTSMCYFLHASRTGFRRTDGLVNKLFVGAVNRGVVAMLMEAAVMITFLTMKSNFIFASLHLMLGKLHTSSLYALLIQRDTLRARQNRATTRSHPTRARIGGSVSGIAGDRSMDFAALVTQESDGEACYEDADHDCDAERARGGDVDSDVECGKVCEAREGVGLERCCPGELGKKEWGDGEARGDDVEGRGDGWKVGR